ERFHPHTEVIHVAPFLTRSGAALLAKLTVDRHEIDHGVAGAQVHQTEVRPPPLHSTAERVAIEVDHALEVGHAQDDVVDVADLEHEVDYSHTRQAYTRSPRLGSELTKRVTWFHVEASLHCARERSLLACHAGVVVCAVFSRRRGAQQPPDRFSQSLSPPART